MTRHEHSAPQTLFNGTVETGLRALSVLTEVFPEACSLQRLVIFDYLLVHSDDVPGGPTGLHPQTPHRSGEILVRRNLLQDGLLLYHSRGLVERRYERDGVFFAATDTSAAFLDALDSRYVIELRDRASWVVDRFGTMPDVDLESLVRDRLSTWGAEFVMESVLFAEESL